MTNTCKLSEKSCEPCKGGIPPLNAEQIKQLQLQLDENWQAVDEHHLERVFSFSNFKNALEFTNIVGEIAEAEGHHPDITLTWGKVSLKTWTHKINGLTESDFILAAKTDKAYANYIAKS